MQPTPIALSFLVLFAACGGEQPAPAPTANGAASSDAPGTPDTAPPAIPVPKLASRKETPENAKPGELVAVQEFYETGQLYTQRSERVAPDGKSRVRVGAMKAWHESGKPMVEGGYDDAGRKSGHWRYWDEQGQLRNEGDYAADLNEGDWIQNHANGQRYRQGFFHASLAEGPWKYWHDNGQPMAEGEYVNNKRQGVWVFYFPDGQPDPAYSGRYEQGQKVQ